MEVRFHRAFLGGDILWRVRHRILDIPVTGSEDEWRAWCARMRVEHPVRFALAWRLPIFLAVCRRRWWDFWWWFGHRLLPAHRYHVVHTGLPPGYYDPSTRILHVTMEEVARLVDGTKDTVDWMHDERHRDAWWRLNVIVEWWGRYKARDDANESVKDADRWEAEAEEMLVEAADLRGFLWFP